MKGIILAGGKGTRLFPITAATSKQILPIYNKPMIYYPLSVLLLSDIRDILIISSREHLDLYKTTLSHFLNSGVHLSFAVQDEPNGLAEAFIIGESFLEGGPACLALGDNVLFGHELPKTLTRCIKGNVGATIFAHPVKNPQHYGVVSFSCDGKIESIEEKPHSPKSDLAVIGLYFYDGAVCRYVKELTPSKRGELEITDLNNIYLSQNRLKLEILGRGYNWFDSGTPESLLETSQFIRTIEERTFSKIACIEEIAFAKKLISETVIYELAKKYKNSYTDYLLKVCQLHKKL